MKSPNLCAIAAAAFVLVCANLAVAYAESGAAHSPSLVSLSTSGNEGCHGCLLLSSHKDCCWYLIGEVGIGIFLKDYPEDEWRDSPKVAFLADGGYMHRLSRQTDIGGTLYFAYDNESPRFGIKPRIRRWLDRRVALDFSAGILLPVMDGDGDGTGFIVSSSISYVSLVAVGVQYENYTPVISTQEVRTGIVTAYVKLGSYVGTVAGILIVTLGVIAGAGS